MSKKTKRERLERLRRRKLWIIAGSIGAVLLLGAWIAWSVLAAMKAEPVSSSKSDQAATDALVSQSKKDGQLRDEAAQKIKSNDTGDAEALYQQAVNSTESAERKTQLYIDLSGVYYAAGKYDEAFTVMQKADSVNPDKFLIADWLSRLYEDQKNYGKAAEYYRLAAQWVTSSQNKTGLDKAYYESKAADMTRLASGAQ